MTPTTVTVPVPYRKGDGGTVHKRPPGTGLRQSRISVGQQECDWAVWVAAVMS